MTINSSALDQILAALTVKVDEVSFCEVASDAAILIEPEDVIEVHFVLTGTLFVKTPVGCAEIYAGGIVAVPPGVFHRVAGSEVPGRIFKSADVFSVRPNGMFTLDASSDEPAEVRIVCGHIRADVSGSFGALQGMKEPLCADLQGDPIIRAAFEAMLREVSSVELGSRTLIAALMKACLVLALRRHAAINGIAKTLPGLFGQPSLARAVAMVLENPAAHHSLSSLAKESGMSRSKFAKVFVEMLGVTPIDFVSRTRLTQGRDLLLSTTLPISDIATMVGFASRSYFSRAFKKAFNADPTTLRRGIGLTRIKSNTLGSDR
ncbi:AraC family transcriptional regulator [Sphingomonas sp. PAMC 26605]|uniref:AraC family transcriptional regulator n=1 Tax=Sphingomonas sp. PAMC 26605 TaxID=1112214 RepID=UPI00026CD7FD|nr:AraC family transcriptional regulator [Sphingomonas sp. PAMC 26605]